MANNTIPIQIQPVQAVCFSDNETLDESKLIIIKNGRIIQKFPGNQPPPTPFRRYKAVEENKKSDAPATKTLKRKSLLDLMEEQRNKKDKTDVNIICEGEYLPCYSQVLHLRSDVFAKMLDIDMKEKQTKEIEIDDMELNVCQAFVTFLHSDKFNETYTDGLLYAAEKYNISTLKIACEEAFIKTISNHNLFSLINKADSYNSENLKSACLNWIANNKKNIKLKGTKEFENLKMKNVKLALEMLESSI